MNKILPSPPRWLPALAVMITIYVFSSRPGDSLPDFLGWDYLIKKTGHILGYALLAGTYIHMLGYRRDKYALVWLMTLTYAMTDEFHQTFVPGRSSSLVDIFIFDNMGAILALLAHSRFKNA